MTYTRLRAHCTPSARVETFSSGHHRLTIPTGEADAYRCAQLDDYFTLPRRKFPHHSLTLSLAARTSNSSLPGTWGFGVWNDPFGLSIGFGGKPFRLPALPNAAWFFGASEENYLSFREPAAGGFAAANGFMAQAFRSPKFHLLVALAGLVFPFSRVSARRLMSRVIAEEGMVLNAPQGQTIRVDPAQWHRYRLEWSPKRVVWEVDEARVFESAVSPNPPLGLVIWIDNQYAAFTPQGKIGFGVLANPEAAWLEIKEVEVG